MPKACNRVSRHLAATCSPNVPMNNRRINMILELVCWKRKVAARNTWNLISCSVRLLDVAGV